MSAGSLEITGGAQIPALRVDAEGDGTVSTEDAKAARAFASQSGPCTSTIASAASASEIAAVEGNDAIDLVMICASADGLTREQRDAVASNAVLMRTLGAAGFSETDVVGVSLGTSGSGVVYLSAS